MTFYQELQLNQAGSKALIRGTEGKKQKLYHMGVYLFKVLLTLAFCIAFVAVFTMVFGEDNKIAGVVSLLCVLVFRYADFGICTGHSIGCLGIIFAILAFGPRLANVGNPFSAFLVNLVCIFLLMLLGCHNVIMSNQYTLILSYLLLYGYDASGEAYLMRLAALGIGAGLTMLVYYHSHRNRTYKRTFSDLLHEFDLFSVRSKWQVTFTLGVSSVVLIATLLGLPRAMWAGIAAMSVMVPFYSDLKERVKRRIPGNICGGAIFLFLYSVLPESLSTLIGMIGGIGNGLSEKYGWQAAFNSLGAMAMAVSLLGVGGSVFFRIFNNVLGALYALVFQKVFSVLLDKVSERKLCVNE